MPVGKMKYGKSTGKPSPGGRQDGGITSKRPAISSPQSISRSKGKKKNKSKMSY